MLEVNYVGNIGRFLNGTTNINIPEPAAGRHPGAPAVSRSYGSDQLLRRLAGDDLPLAADVGRAAHARRPVLPGLLHVVEELHDAERAGRRRQHRPREGALRLRRAAQRRHQRRLRAAVRPRAAVLLPTRNAVVEAVLGGWQVQGIYIWRSGRPFTPTISSDRANTGVGGQRPNRLGSGELDDPTVEVWFDKTAFVLPAQFTYGDSGGNILREDSYKTLDFSLFKQFRFGDAPPAVPRRGVQPDQHTELQRAQHRDRHGGGRARHQHRRAARVRCSSR